MSIMTPEDRLEVAAEAMREMAFPEMTKDEVRELFEAADDYASTLFSTAPAGFYAALPEPAKSLVGFEDQYQVFARVVKMRFEKGVQ